MEGKAEEKAPAKGYSVPSVFLFEGKLLRRFPAKEEVMASKSKQFIWIDKVEGVSKARVVGGLNLGIKYEIMGDMETATSYEITGNTILLKNEVNAFIQDSSSKTKSRRKRGF